MPSRAYIPKKIEDCSINGNSSIPDGDKRRAEEEDSLLLFFIIVVVDGVVGDAAAGDKGDGDVLSL